MMSSPCRALFAALAFFLSASAQAGGLTVQLSNGAKPVADAVVTLHAIARPTPAARMGGPFLVNQKDIQFHPFVSVVPVGADVSFPNLDPIKHHVYSFSPAKRFELKLYAKDQTRSVHFDAAGIVAVGCNIHDSMSAYIFVADSGWTAKSDAAGRVTIASLPPGNYTLTVWHPYLRAPASRIDRPLVMTAADHREDMLVSLRTPPMHDMSGY